MHPPGDKTFELRVQEDRHREEVAALQKTLRWYAENQQLLDRDAARLRAATAETQQLNEQVGQRAADEGSCRSVFKSTELVLGWSWV